MPRRNEGVLQEGIGNTAFGVVNLAHDTLET